MITRWPAIAAIALCVTALVVADQADRRPVAAQLADEVSSFPMPVASSPESLGSSWYCAAGLVDASRDHDHVIILTNPGDDQANGRVTFYPAVPDGRGSSTAGEPLERLVSLPAGGQIRLSLAEFLPELPEVFSNAVEVYAAALVEFDLGGIAAEHAVLSPEGVGGGPCASSAASDWYFASSTTTLGVRNLIALFNPFAGNAVVDVSFATDGGIREPGAYDGLVIPGRSVLVVDTSTVVTVNAQMAVSIEARAGRFVAERLQLFGAPEGPRGMSLALGTSEPGIQWFFPAGRSVAGAGESYVIYNPGDIPADIDFEVRLDAPEENGEIPPFAINVPARQRVVVVIDETENQPLSTTSSVRRGDRIPEAVGYWAAVRSFNDIPVVVERVVTVEDDNPVGVTTTVGAPLASTVQRVALPTSESLRSVLAVLNPAGDTISRVTVTAVGGAGSGSDQLAEIELPPRSRGVVDLGQVPTDALALLIESSTPIMAELASSNREGATSMLAIPDSDTADAPDLFSF